MLAIDDVTFGYGDVSSSPVLRRVSLELESGNFMGILGPNGSGKTTLLKLINGLYVPWSGGVAFEGRQVKEMSRRQIASRMAVVPQKTTVEFDFTVRQMVNMGRTPYLSRFGGESPRDRRAVRRALERTGTSDLAERAFGSLSGGEQQRVIVARTLAQEPDLLLLDEPTSHLDIAHQMRLLELLRDLNEGENLTILMVLHDVNLASMFCHRILFLKEGEVFDEGPPVDVINQENIEKIYECPVSLGVHPDKGCPQIFLS